MLKNRSKGPCFIYFNVTHLKSDHCSTLDVTILRIIDVTSLYINKLHHNRFRCRVKPKNVLNIYN